MDIHIVQTSDGKEVCEELHGFRESHMIRHIDLSTLIRAAVTFMGKEVCG